MEENLTNCFICDTICVTKDKYLGSQVAHQLIMPLSSLLSKCLQSTIDIQNEYFCGECSRKIEEYGQLVQLSLQIETELYEQFQNKLIKSYQTNEDVNIDCQRPVEAVNEVLIIHDVKSENDDTENQLVSDDKSSQHKQVTINKDENGENLGEKTKRYETRKKKHKFSEPPPAKIKPKKIQKKKNDFPKQTKPKSSPYYKVEEVICDYCGRKYMSKGGLSIHMIKHLERSPYECKICNKTFTQSGGLARHMPIHTGEKNFQCDVCGKQFIHEASFNMHKRMHLDERPKKCTVCGAKFRSNSHIIRHMRTHTGEKPYPCPICHQRFAQRYNMRTHYKTHEKISKDTKQHECLICPEKFARREKLIEHLAQRHQASFDPSVGT